jgi:hypothetical protein
MGRRRFVKCARRDPVARRIAVETGVDSPASKNGKVLDRGAKVCSLFVHVVVIRETAELSAEAVPRSAACKASILPLGEGRRE